MRPGGGLGRESVGNGTVTSVPLLTEKTRDGEGACELQRVKLIHVFRTDLRCATQVCTHLNLLSMVRISCGYVSRTLSFVYIYVWAGEGTPARRTQA